MADLLSEEYTQIGSAEREVFFNKNEALQFLYETIHQVAGKFEMRNRNTSIELLNDTFIVYELCDAYALVDEKWLFYNKFRATTLLQKKKLGWKFIHQHSSFSDSGTSDGQNVSIEKITAENQQRCLDAGMNEYATKPYKFDDLQAMIDKLVSPPLE